MAAILTFCSLFTLFLTGLYIVGVLTSLLLVLSPLLTGWAICLLWLGWAMIRKDRL